jgi:hypothetical protein
LGRSDRLLISLLLEDWELLAHPLFAVQAAAHQIERKI